MSPVDIHAIEDAMKAQQLEQNRGYRQDTYAEVQQTRQAEYMSEEQALGAQILHEPLWNKGQFSPHVISAIGLVQFSRSDCFQPNTNALQVWPSRQNNVWRRTSPAWYHTRSRTCKRNVNVRFA